MNIFVFRSAGQQSFPGNIFKKKDLEVCQSLQNDCFIIMDKESILILHI